MRHRVCPQCRQNLRGDNALCPFCGTNVKTGKGAPTFDWRAKEQAQDTAIIGGLASCLIFLGCTLRGMGGEADLAKDKLDAKGRADAMFWATHGEWLSFALPVAVIGLLYLITRRRFPAFARGLLRCFLVILVFMLLVSFCSIVLK